MTHWYLPSLEDSTWRSCSVVVYSVTWLPSPACARRWAWLWISALFSTSLSFFHAKVMGESLELAAEHTKVTLVPLMADCVSGWSVIWGLGKSAVHGGKSEKVFHEVLQKMKVEQMSAYSLAFQQARFKTRQVSVFLWLNKIFGVIHYEISSMMNFPPWERRPHARSGITCMENVHQAPTHHTQIHPGWPQRHSWPSVAVDGHSWRCPRRERRSLPPTAGTTSAGSHRADLTYSGAWQRAKWKKKT